RRAGVGLVERAAPTMASADVPRVRGAVFRAHWSDRGLFRRVASGTAALDSIARPWTRQLLPLHGPQPDHGLLSRAADARRRGQRSLEEHVHLGAHRDRAYRLLLPL